MFDNIIEYLSENYDEFFEYLFQHVSLGLRVLALVMVIGIPLGYLCYRNQKVSIVVTSITNVLRVIPSLALMMLVIPFLGIGDVPAILALCVLALPPIVINTRAGFESIDKTVIETGRGMGMNNRQILLMVEVPLAVPVMMTGIRTAAVETVASTSLAAYIGAGGLGILVYAGLNANMLELLLVGGVSIAILALSTDLILMAVQKLLTKNISD